MKQTVYHHHARRFPVAYVISNNLHRRQLTESQRAMVAARTMEIYARKAKERQAEHGNTAPGRTSNNTSGHLTGSVFGESRDKAGEDFHVSGKSVDNLRGRLVPGPIISRYRHIDKYAEMDIMRETTGIDQ